jgi:Zn-dependent alcohol dehydrogenase
MEDVTGEAIKDDELLVEIVATGVRHSDFYFATMPKDIFPYPKVLGREGKSLQQILFINKKQCSLVEDES